MFLSSRHSEIIQMAKDNGRVLVDDLATHFEVTPQTIRKDLNDLCDQRLLTRIHGGALFPSGIENMEYEARRKIASDEKEAIGRAAARLIPDNASLFINIGTTTEAVSKALLDHEGLMVITNNPDRFSRYDVHVFAFPDCPHVFSPLLMSVPLQLFAYYSAGLRGCDIDQPRNLAKSVVVE